MPKKELSSGIQLSELARIVEGRLIGNPQIRVKGICPIDHPEKDCLSFLRNSKPRDIEVVAAEEKIAALLVTNAKGITPKGDNFGLIEVSDPLAAVIKLVPHFFASTAPAPGISKHAEVHPTASIGSGVSIAAFCSVGPNAVIGDNTVLHPQVCIYPGAKIGARSVLHSGVVVREDCVIGDDTVLQNGAVIGADGFGYIADALIGLRAVPQVGNVVLQPRVEVGANSCVDRGTFGSTEIGWGTKLDNLVQIGHNTVIGKHSIICGLSGVAGSCELGDRVVLGGNAGVADHKKIASGTRIAAKSGVIQDISEKGDYAGVPAVPSSVWLKQSSLLRKLPELLKHLRITVPTHEK